MTPEQALEQHFGLSAFRKGQRLIIDAVLEGRDLLGILPTGAGKSLCYQLPAMMMDGVAIVISPLIALMRNQVQALQAKGLPAAALYSALTEDEELRILRDLKSGNLKMLYLSPERFSQLGMMRILRQSRISFVVIDEAHCANQWGHDFRPAYLALGKPLAQLGRPVAAFTATADKITRDEVKAQLFNGRQLTTYLGKFDRPNLHLSFCLKDKPRQQILDLAESHRGQAGIIYCATRARTESLAQALVDAGHDALAYHAGMESDRRREVEAAFLDSDDMIIAATIAFGMGIDKPNIRWVAHADLPKNLESYYQEVGRAGRDGLPADAICLYGKDDLSFRRDQIKESQTDPIREELDLARFDAMLAVAMAKGCRRQPLLSYFGEDCPACGRCDLCDGAAPSAELSMDLQGEGAALLSALKAKRLEIATQKGIPPYFVLGDWILEDVARQRPKDLDALSKIEGIGKRRMERYGAALLTVVNGAAPLVHPTRAKLAGQENGILFDAIFEACDALKFGSCGTLKPMSLTTAQIARVIRARPNSLQQITDLLGAKYTDRFGDAILDLMKHH